MTSSSQSSALSMDDLFAELDSGPGGLTADDAAKRLADHGPNEIVEERKHPLLVFLGYFWSPIPWMIEVALVLSLAVQHWTDAIIIGVLLAMNGAVAFAEEHEAANAIEALKSRLSPEARVRRDGNWTTLPTRELVPGDVIRLRLGDVVPADARIVDGAELHVDQSALTGESLPVTKSHGEVLYSGASVVQGEVDALVYATGADSFFGETTALVQTSGTVSHFQQAVLRIGRYLIVFAVALVALTSVVSILRGNALVQTLEYALVVTIASVPVALPAVLSVTMAVGARELARRKAVVSHLPAVEELGGVDVLCSDKTGTLTQNQLAVEEQWCPPGVDESDLVRAAAQASREEDQDPIDLAIVAANSSRGGTAPGEVLDFTPFDPVNKRTEALVRMPTGGETRVTKGAPQVIADLCGGGTAVEDALSQVEQFASRGYRSLAVAEGGDDGEWRLLGVLALADPPREDSAETIAAARDLGVDVKMVTGDQVAIGVEIARQVGLGPEILPAGELGDVGEIDDDVADRVESADGFAEVFPEHKHRIVELLQRRGHIVGMTGDGVNDAPALKQADAGIAVSGATDAARDAADVVLLAPGLSVIVAAIRLAREIFARMTSYATYRIAETIRVLLLVVLAVVAFDIFPVTAKMIVLLAILNDAAILTISYDHAQGSRRPTSWDMRSVLTVATALGVLGVLETFLLFAIAHQGFGLDESTVRTLIYLKLSVSGHLTVFVARTRGPFWTRPAPAKVLVSAVVGTQVLATLIAVYGVLMTPLGWSWAAVVWAYALFWFVVEDRTKLATYAVMSRRAGADVPEDVARTP